MKSIKECIRIVKKAIKEDRTINDICVEEKNGVKNYVSDIVYRIKKGKNVKNSTEKDIQELLSIFEEYKELNKNTKKSNSKKDVIKTKFQQINTEGINLEDELTDEEFEQIEYDAYQDDDYDERSKGEIIRDKEGEDILVNNVSTKRISGYHYCILIKNQQPLEGFLTREQMEMLHRLYSSIEGGAGLTIRAVSREFSYLTYVDLKRIIRAFNITKQSLPIPQHILEEKPESEILELFTKIKSDNILKKLEINRFKNAEKTLIETTKELCELKKCNQEIKDVIKKILSEKIVPLRIEQRTIENKRALIVYLSDMHIGAYVPEDSIYTNKYDEEEVVRRLEVVLNKIKEQYEIFGRFEKLIVCNLGDALDGFDRQTVRRHHELSQNMDNKQQYAVFVNNMMKFFETIHKMNVANNIEYHAVTDDNHSGIAGYVANKTLGHVFEVKYPDMYVNIFEKFIQHFVCFNHTFILTHGKDSKHQKFGYPLQIDDKSEKKLEEYIRINKIFTPSISVCKGDLHQSATTYGKRIRYKSIPSFFGSSDYIHVNYGNTPAAFEFEIITENSNEISNTLIELN